MYNYRTVNILALACREGVLLFTHIQVKEHLVKVLSKATSSAISPELEAKNQLLKNNPNLYQLYKDLVTTGLISAEEFWANQTLDRGAQHAESAQAQESGLPSAFLVSVQNYM